MVKQLGGFKKGHHTLPDAVTPATSAFLARITQGDLAEQAETLYQQVRAGLEYKRTAITLQVASPGAVLTTRDFVVEILYTLVESNAAQYTVLTTLRDLRGRALAERPEFTAIFARRFTEISFELKKGVRVESVIDAIEGLPKERGLGVTYPSDASECIISAEAVDAAVRCNGASLELIFPRAGSPAELLDGFAAVRSAFQVSVELSRLIT